MQEQIDGNKKKGLTGCSWTTWKKCQVSRTFISTDVSLKYSLNWLRRISLFYHTYEFLGVIEGFFLSPLLLAARRANGKISLEDVLKFVTGCETEPVLGFQMKPSIFFDAAMPSCIPTSNTCINRLTLAIGDIVPDGKEELFQFFDYAFLNDYFGRM